MGTMGTVAWPEVVTNKDFEYASNEKNLALGEGLVSWATCMSGHKPPENFGFAMIKIGKLLGCVGTHEGLMEYAKQNKIGE